MTDGDVFTVTDPDGVAISVHQWLSTAPKAVVHIVHGLGEHAARYARLAQELNAAGYHVYADDHRGHGRTGIAMGGIGPLGPRGMTGTLDAVHAVSEHVASNYPELPLVLLGHSWGSFLAQKFVQRWGDELDALVLTGTTILVPPFRDMATFNDDFEPATTPSDWLSRDPAEVAKYVADPWCGFPADFPYDEMAQLAGPPTDAVPASLPILIMNGAADPVGGEARGHELMAAYREVGVDDVTYLCYLDARHELFNETNRAEVTEDLVDWLDAHV